MRNVVTDSALLSATSSDLQSLIASFGGENSESERAVLGLQIARVIAHAGLMTVPLRRWCDLLAVLHHWDEHLSSTLFTPLAAFDAPLPESALHYISEPIKGDPITQIGFWYERMAPALHAQRPGMVYTPPALARAMASDACDLYERESGQVPEAVLDPACGSAAFLIAAAREMRRRLAARGARNKRITHTDVVHRLCGTDTDPTALNLAKYLVALDTLIAQQQRDLFPQTLFRVLAENLKVGNALLDPFNLPTVSTRDHLAWQQSPLRSAAIDWSVAFGHIFASRGGFDLILGNPPYGISRDQRLPREELAVLKRHYHRTLSGKVNTYLLFITRSHSLLNQRGVLNLLIPNAWLGIRDANASRELLIGEQAIREIQVFEKPIFPDHSVEVISLCASRAMKKDSFLVKRMNGTVVSAQSEIQFSACAQRLGTTITPTWSAEIAALCRDAQRESFPLGGSESPFVCRIALQAYATGKGSPPQTIEQVKAHAFHCQEPAPNAYPYLEGSDICRFQINWSGGYLTWGEWLAEPQSLDRFSGPRVLIREILGPAHRCIIAATATTPSLYNKSVLHILPRPDTPEGLIRALTALLNSSVASLLLKTLGRKSQRRLFPKVVLDDLKILPIPMALLTDWHELAAIEQRLSSASTSPDEQVLDELDRAAIELYHLCPEARHAVLSQREQKSAASADSENQSVGTP